MRLDYDEGGKLARKGMLDQPLLDRLNSLEFYSKAGPKSLGREWIETEILPILDAHPGTIPDLLCTFGYHIARQISLVVNQEVEARGSQQHYSLLPTGGGTYNVFLLDLLSEEMPQVDISIPDEMIIDFKEALVFGLMGVLRVRNEINCYQTVTGASSDSSLGQLWSPHLQ